MNRQETAAIQDPLYAYGGFSKSIQHEDVVDLRPFPADGVQMERRKSKPWDGGTLRASSAGPSFHKSFV